MLNWIRTRHPFLWVALGIGFAAGAALFVWQWFILGPDAFGVPSLGTLLFSCLLIWAVVTSGILTVTLIGYVLTRAFPELRGGLTRDVDLWQMGENRKDEPEHSSNSGKRPDSDPGTGKAST